MGKFHLSDTAAMNPRGGGGGGGGGGTWVFRRGGGWGYIHSSSKF